MNRHQPVSDNAKYSNIINNTKGMYIGNSYANTPDMYTSPNTPQMYSKAEGMTEKVIKGMQDNIDKAKERLKNKEDILLNRKVDYSKSMNPHEKITDTLINSIGKVMYPISYNMYLDGITKLSNVNQDLNAEIVNINDINDKLICL